MLGEVYYRKTDEIISRYVREARSLIPIMQDIQAEYRYLPAELLSYVAKEIGVTEAHAYSVATFYENFSFEAKGKYVIKVCDGTACHVCHSTPVLEALWKELGLSNKKHTTDDMLFTVETYANVPKIILDGADWFRSIGTPGSPGCKTFSLTGAIENTGLIEVPMGSTLRQIIFDIGGGQPTDGTKVARSAARTKGLYAADGDMAIKKSNENPLMDVFYNGYFKGKAHELLHNHHE